MDFEVGGDEGAAKFFGVGQGDIKAVVNKENFPQAVAFLHFPHFPHHFVHRADNPPGVGRRLRARSGGIAEIAQLGQDADAKAGPLILVHIQVVKAGRLGKLRGAAHSVVADLPRFSIDQARQVKIAGFADFQPPGQFRKGFAGIPGQAQIRLQIGVALLRQQAESRATADDGRGGQFPHPVNDRFGDRQGPLGVEVAVIAQVPQGKADQFRLKIPYRLFHRGQVVLGEHQVQGFQLMPFRVEMAGNVGHPDGQGAGIHPAHQPLVPVSGNQ